ncbi:MAG TPA: sigma-70 family RNA polymerase sigma factor [Blastocatellia bacterium]|nr:sigma-70 family RNA polymerase sigma factor [Blastocatellia bacterium]
MLMSQNINEIASAPQTFISSPVRVRKEHGQRFHLPPAVNPNRVDGSVPYSPSIETADGVRYHAAAEPVPVNEANDASVVSDTINEDSVLLNSLASGETDAFWVLWMRHRKYLFSICLKRLPSAPEDAEDVLSRAMLRAWEKLPSQAWKIENAKAWLARLTINLCVDAYREKKRRSAGCETVDDVALSDAHLAVCSSQSPEQNLLRDELRSRVRGAVDDLPVHIKSPFVLHFVEDFACKDVGERLYLTPENVRKRIQRARSILRKRLGPYVAA